MEYAMEADPGRLTASFPTFDSIEEADRAASFLNARTPHLPPVRILMRDAGPGGAWLLARPDGVAIFLDTLERSDPSREVQKVIDQIRSEREGAA